VVSAKPITNTAFPATKRSEHRGGACSRGKLGQAQNSKGVC